MEICDQSGSAKRRLGGHCELQNSEEYSEQLIATSWKRCLHDYGLQPSKAPYIEQSEPKVVAQAFDLNGDILSVARHGLELLNTQMGPAGYALLLADADSLALDSIVPNNFDQSMAQSLSAGKRWSERNAGTNGIGTCTHDKKPLTVHKQEHFHTVNRQLSCSVAPIFSPTGDLVACVNATCLDAPNDKRSQTLALQMVMAQCHQVEQEHLCLSYRKQHIIQLTPLDIGPSQHQILSIAVNAEERVVGATGAAFRWFESRSTSHKYSSLLGRSVESLFGMNLDDLYVLDGDCRAPEALAEHSAANRFALKIQEPKMPRSNRQLVDKRNRPAANSSMYPTMGALCAFDDQLAAMQPRMERVVDRDISILLQGETGTGKEVFARALHNISSRANGPFVALNCASIPESLIESELFGYSAGSFTGARKQGMKGKLELASGGTLFLDEIGDMPVLLQTRLLRVLAEREIHPLGTDFPQAIDVQIISATHQDLPALIDSQQFRQDLYFRLNGAIFNIPPLRARKDFRELVAQLLLIESEGQKAEVCEQAFDVLHQHHWPGNIRELKNTLRYAHAIASCSKIEVADLPHALNLRTDPQAASEVSSESVRRSPLHDSQAQHLKKILDQYDWNISCVARVLKLSRSTVYRKMKRYGLAIASKP